MTIDTIIKIIPAYTTHPSMERMTHHDPPLLGSPLPLVPVTYWYDPTSWVRRGSPSPWCLLRLVLTTAFSLPAEKDDSPPTPLSSTWCLLQNGTPTPLWSAEGPPPLGVCYRLV